MYYPGDILFYKSKHSLYDDAITIVEGDPNDFVHVAIAISGLQKIEAVSNGIVLTQISNSSVDAVWSYIEEVPEYNPTNLHNALNWLLSQKGNVYGWSDAVNALIEKEGFNFTVNVGNHEDCSGLACLFVQGAGGVPQLIGVNAHNITPQEFYNRLYMKINNNKVQV